MNPVKHLTERKTPEQLAATGTAAGERYRKTCDPLIFARFRTAVESPTSPTVIVQRMGDFEPLDYWARMVGDESATNWNMSPEFVAAFVKAALA